MSTHAAGGRDLSGNKRTAPQTSDQPLNNNNASLVKSCDDHTPVRVVRGKRSGAYAPTEGYRYDGLYYVTRYWQEPGQSGFKVWRFKVPRTTAHARHTHDTHHRTRTTRTRRLRFARNGRSSNTARTRRLRGRWKATVSTESGGTPSTASRSCPTTKAKTLMTPALLLLRRRRRSHHRTTATEEEGKRRVKLEEERDDGGHGHKKETSAKTTKATKKKKGQEKPAHLKKRKVMEAHSAGDKENVKNGSSKRAA